MIKTCSATRLPGDSQRAGNGPVDSATLPGASTRNDGALLTVLRRDLGEAAFRDVLAALDEEMERRLRSLQQEPWDWPGIRNDTQAMLSLAAGFGFVTLATLSRTVLSTDRHPSSHFTEVLRPYVAEVHRLRSTFAALRPTVGLDRGAVIVGARPMRDGAS
ncbi:hypothetical protein [Azospirillum sp.]|uniref:hypothetical protein n=1 Tax=Azospirillum sp. TaxID=34012 RepID=UPI002D2BEAA1|nr:hypothetical protein [Azospirillum sp.]HYD65757.1 hypothetical protein [Azospirillum sp.]